MEFFNSVQWPGAKFVRLPGWQVALGTALFLLGLSIEVNLCALGIGHS